MCLFPPHFSAGKPVPWARLEDRQQGRAETAARAGALRGGGSCIQTSRCGRAPLGSTCGSSSTKGDSVFHTSVWSGQRGVAPFPGLRTEAKASGLTSSQLSGPLGRLQQNPLDGLADQHQRFVPPGPGGRKAEREVPAWLGAGEVSSCLKDTLWGHL